MNPRTLKKLIALTLVASTTWVCGAQPAAAMMAPAQTAVQAAGASGANADRAKVASFLEQKMVRQRLADFGLNAAQIQSRLSRLSDADVHQVAMRIDKQNPAGDASGALITVLVIGILATLFIYLVKRV